MLVTCIGLPGSGKSYFVRALVTVLPQVFERVVLTGRFDRFFWFMVGVFLLPSVAFLFLQAILQQPIRLWPYLFHLWTVSLAEEAKGAFLTRRFPKRLYVIDEGILQRTFSFADGALFPSLWSRALSVSWPHAVLVFSGGDFGRFEAAPDAATSPRVKTGERAYRAWKEAFQHAFASAQRALPQTGKAIPLNIRNVPDLREEIARVQAALERLRPGKNVSR